MAEKAEKTVGVIGGSGLYEIEGLTDVKRVKVETPFGDGSDEFTTGTLGDTRMVFLPRHGRGHRLLPGEINYRANIYGMKKLGCEWLISVSAVGSMREEIEPGHVVIVDQFFDRTNGRASTFFGSGLVGHVEFAEPVCPSLMDVLYGAAKKAAATAHRGGDVPVHRGAPLLDEGRVQNIQVLGRGRHRDDEHTRGEACPGGRDMLRHHRSHNGLRLLA